MNSNKAYISRSKTLKHYFTKNNFYVDYLCENHQKTDIFLGWIDDAFLAFLIQGVYYLS